MISLFLDTADKDITVAIFRENEQLLYVNEVNDNHLSERLLPLIDKSFKSLKMTVDEVDKIFVVNGPGSFTGVRIGVTVAKVIASSLKKDIVVISELEVLSTTFTGKKYVVPLIDARRDFVYGAMYDKKLNKVIKDEHILYSELIENIKLNYDLNDVEFVSHYDYESSIKPNIDISKIIKKHYSKKTMNPHKVIPNYLKKTEAEEKRVNRID